MSGQVQAKSLARAMVWSNVGGSAEASWARAWSAQSIFGDKASVIVQMRGWPMRRNHDHQDLAGSLIKVGIQTHAVEVDGSASPPACPRCRCSARSAKIQAATSSRSSTPRSARRSGSIVPATISRMIPSSRTDGVRGLCRRLSTEPWGHDGMPAVKLPPFQD